MLGTLSTLDMSSKYRFPKLNQAVIEVRPIIVVNFACASEPQPFRAVAQVVRNRIDDGSRFEVDNLKLPHKRTASVMVHVFLIAHQ
jgi:hypothetical protein